MINYKEIDPFDEEDWDEVEPDGSFLYWLKENYPDESKWDKIINLNCSNKQLTSLKGIESLSKLEFLYCSYNQLTSFEGIENLTNLKTLYCYHNQLTSFEGIDQLTSFEGIENLSNLTEIDCYNNQLTSLKGIEQLTNLRTLYCYDNQFSDEYKDYLRSLNIRTLRL